MGDFTLCLGFQQIEIGGRNHGCGGVVDDARGDQLGREIGFVGVHDRRIKGRNIGPRVGHQTAFGFQAFHGDHIGNQQHVGLWGTGGEFGAQPGHDLGGAIVDPFHLNRRVKGLKGVNGLLRIGVWLRCVNHQLARNILSRRRDSLNRRIRSQCKNPFHFHTPISCSAGRRCRSCRSYPIFMTAWCCRVSGDARALHPDTAGSGIGIDHLKTCQIGAQSQGDFATIRQPGGQAGALVTEPIPAAILPPSLPSRTADINRLAGT